MMFFFWWTGLLSLSQDRRAGAVWAGLCVEVKEAEGKCAFVWMGRDRGGGIPRPDNNNNNKKGELEERLCVYSAFIFMP